MGGGKYKSSGRPVLSQIISEHLVIVAQRGSKITFLPTLHTPDSMSYNISHVQLKKKKKTQTRKPSTQNALGNRGRRELGTTLGAAQLSAHHHINYSSKKFACN